MPDLSSVPDRIFNGFDFDGLAKVLADGLLASYLLGIDQVRRETKRAASFADPELPAPLSFGVKPEEAIEYFRSKQVVTRKEFDLLAEDARSAAFTVSGIYKQDILEGFKSEIADSLEQGTSQKELAKRLRSILAGAGHRQLGAFHLETVIRVNQQMALGVGRRRSLEAVTEDFPFWQYHSVGDDRVRPTHQVLDGVILPANHDFWRDHYPPWEFNDRCSVTATDSIPDDYNHQNPSGTGEIFYDENGIPTKAEIGTAVYDLAAQGKFRGVPPQGGLKDTIEAGAARAVRKPRAATTRPKTPKPVKTPEPTQPPQLELPSVSSAISGFVGPVKFEKQMKEALRILDQVHRDGTLPKIPMKQVSRAKYEGAYAYNAWTREAGDIRISNRADHPELTMFHEVGHFLDQQGVGKRQYASLNDPRLKEWRDAVSNSKAVKRLLELSREKYTNLVVDGQQFKYYVDQRYVRYLLKVEEIWARSYAQFIAVKSNNAVAVKQLKGLRRGPTGQPVPYPSQWEDEDFEPIKTAIEKLFRSLGWLQ